VGSCEYSDEPWASGTTELVRNASGELSDTDCK
jgi:hypothetical protein